MTKRAARQSFSAPQTPPTAKARRSRKLAVWLSVSFVLPLVILLVLKTADVRLGQGYFFIRYSPLSLLRLERVLPLTLGGVLACAAIWASIQPKRSTRIAAAGLLASASIAAGVWLWWAPPNPFAQQVFNLRSFSTDGAFLFEASKIESLPKYLEKFPERLKQTPEVMGGTRVLSNPPLVTVLAYGLCYAWRSDPQTLDRLEQLLIDEYDADPELAKDGADAVRTSIMLCTFWVLSGGAAYMLGRRFLSPTGATLFAIVVTFNPCTVHYTPGKDSAQLLTINLMLWAWFAAWQRRSIALAALGGAILTIGSTAGLVHIWVALAAVVATAWQAIAERAGYQKFFVSSFAAAAGGLIVCLAAWLGWGWNIPATLLAVSRRWGELQSTFEMNRSIWYAIGLPIFILFLSPGFWALLGLSLHRTRRIGLGLRVTLSTAAIMLFIYGPLGMTYELPRLWIAFLPLLILGLSIDLPMLRIASHSKRAAYALIVIAAAQIGFTALHWTLFDARETEFRLMTHRLFN